MGAISLHAQADFMWKYERPTLGASDRYGYAVWTTPLALLSLDGASIPLHAEFSSDPRPSPSPSPLGRGWAVNFFSSALVEIDQDSMRWHRPDGRIFFFVMERGSTANRRGPNDAIVFISKDNSWTAAKAPRQRFITLKHLSTGAEFIYSDGLLVRFSFNDVAQSNQSYSITYNRARRPSRLSELGSGKVLAEFLYDDPERAKLLNLGEAPSASVMPIEFEYMAAALHQFDSGPYLSKINSSTLIPLSISYAKDSAAANRILFERGIAIGRINLAWDAKSGFILADEGSEYRVINPSLVNGGKPLADSESENRLTDYNWRPDEARVTRIDQDGKSEYRFYDRSKGILTIKDKDGATSITSYLMTSGLMYGKVRKIEHLDPKGVIQSTERRAYDEKGRIVRTISATGSVTLWEYLEDGNRVLKSIDGTLSQENKYVNGRIKESTRYGALGAEKYEYKYTANGESATYTINGKLVWKRFSPIVGETIFTRQILDHVPPPKDFQFTNN
jgi:hypothetical protein